VDALLDLWRRMMILDKIVESTKLRVESQKQVISIEKMIEKATKLEPKTNFPFEIALRNIPINFICEVKKASPSKGIITKDFPYLDIAKDYEAAGASCISVLTEPEFFKGSDTYLSEIKQNVTIPVLRKDFTIDPYQIYQAKVLGADCILLICSILSENQLREYLSLCDKLGLSALVEAHDEEEINKSIRVGARMIGVNNRNLKTFEVDINNSIRLRKLVPDDIIFIAESGIKTSKDIKLLIDANVNGVLIGETLMRSNNKSEMLKELKGEYILGNG
jgi:indole-3-glycerol phosphate synthase